VFCYLSMARRAAMPMLDSDNELGSGALRPDFVPESKIKVRQTLAFAASVAGHRSACGSLSQAGIPRRVVVMVVKFVVVLFIGAVAFHADDGTNFFDRALASDGIGQE